MGQAEGRAKEKQGSVMGRSGLVCEAGGIIVCEAGGIIVCEAGGVIVCEAGGVSEGERCHCV